jgi:methylglyoxal synthase
VKTPRKNPERRSYVAQYHEEVVGGKKRVALVAHDNMKDELIGWCVEHRSILATHSLIATGTTGALLRKALHLPVDALASGPLGGDQQLGARITDGMIDIVIFLWDPLEAQPHDPDVRALLRIAGVWNIPVASNRSSADFLITSPFFSGKYVRRVPKYPRSTVVGRP